jgi:hypothetical protein
MDASEWKEYFEKDPLPPTTTTSNKLFINPLLENLNDIELKMGCALSNIETCQKRVGIAMTKLGEEKMGLEKAKSLYKDLQRHQGEVLAQMKKDMESRFPCIEQLT